MGARRGGGALAPLEFETRSQSCDYPLAIDNDTSMYFPKFFSGLVNCLCKFAVLILKYVHVKTYDTSKGVPEYFLHKITNFVINSLTATRAAACSRQINTINTIFSVFGLLT